MDTKLKEIEDRFIDVEKQLSSPDIMTQMDKFTALSKEHSVLSPIIEKYREHRSIKERLSLAEESFKTEKDSDLKEMLYDEIGECRELLPNVLEELKILLLPKDPDDDRNVVIEIRAGAGGDEAGLFGASLERMYKRYAERQGLSIEDLENSYTELGGVKEAVFLLKGTGCFAKLKYESGVHRVQRVPETENQGRVHTSTATVAVLPEATEVDATYNTSDLKIDTYRSGGAGGQHVNKTESAIRVTHLPTGLVVTCEDERSQVQNKEKALKILGSRLKDFYRQKADKEYADHRKSQVGTGDRSERIRTYNFPQGRITDHRIGFTAYNLPQFMDGDIEAMVQALAIYDQNERLKSAKD